MKKNRIGYATIKNLITGNSERKVVRIKGGKILIPAPVEPVMYFDKFYFEEQNQK